MSTLTVSRKKSSLQMGKRFDGIRVSIVVGFVLFLNSLVSAQWNTNGNDIHNTNSGNVGIGTNTPQEDLEIFGSTGGVDLLFNKSDSIGWRFRHHGVTGSFRLGFTGDFINYDTKWAVMPNGNVGLGILDPRESLEIRKDGGSSSVLLNVDNNFGWRIRNHLDTRTFRIAYTTDFSTYDNNFTIKPNGNVGIGTIDPREALEIRKDGGTADVLLNVDNNFGWRLRNHRDTQTFRIAYTSDFQTYNNSLTINANGNVGINTTEPQSELAVNGRITAKEVQVTLNGWSDFVFEENYALIPLEEVEKHLKRNKRLPDIPSEKEVLENGVSLGEMQVKLLQKIEELTLYVIQLKKENDALKGRITSLE